MLDQVLRERLKFVIENKHQGATRAPDHIGQGSLVKRQDSFMVVHAGDAMERIFVHFLSFGLSRLHHHAPTHSVGRICKKSCHYRGCLYRDKIVFVYVSLTLIIPVREATW